jgi:hypothetical protein
MSNTVTSILESHDAPNHILYSLLYFIHHEQPELEIDINAPIEHIEEHVLVLAVCLSEIIRGIDVPDKMILDRTKSLQQLADEIRLLPKLMDEEFQKKLLLTKTAFRLDEDRN